MTQIAVYEGGVPVPRDPDTQDLGSVSASERDFSRIVRNSTTQFQVEETDGERDFLIVNGETVSLATPTVCNVSGGSVHNLIDGSDGSDLETQPSASTGYHIYHSNSEVTWAASVPRLCATAPTSGEHLGSTGDAANWRRIGFIKLDGSTQIANAWNICEKGIKTFDEELSSTITKSSGGAGYYEILTLQDFALMKNTELFIMACTKMGYNVSANPYFRLRTNATQRRISEQQDTAGGWVSGSVNWSEKSGSNQAFDIDLYYYYKGSDTMQIAQSDTAISIVRYTP